MTDETNPTPGQPTTPAQPGQPQQPAPAPPAAALPPAAGAVPPSASVPPPPAGYGQAAPSGFEPPTPPKKKGVGLRIARIVASVVVVLLIGVGYKAYQNHHETASAPAKGACVQAKDTQTDHPTVKKVDCSDTSAEYVVLAKVSGGSSTSCDTVSGTEAAFTSTRGTKTLYVLCLKHK